MKIVTLATQLRAAYIYHYMLYGVAAFYNRIRDVRAFLDDLVKYIPLT